MISRLRWVFNKASGRLVNYFVKSEVNPFHLTMVGFVLTVMASFFYIQVSVIKEYLIFAAVSLITAGLFDALDGEVARKSGRASTLGSFTDSFFDRIEDGLVALAIAYSNIVEPLFALIYVITSSLTSYLRAKGEAIGLKMEGIGIAERGDRIMMITVGTVIEYFLANILNLTMLILIVVGIATIAQRTAHIYKNVKGI